MLQLKTEFLNTSIFIIDGLKDNEMQTGRRLYDDMDCYKKYSETPSVKYKKVLTREDLLRLFSEIREYCKNGGFPILHFEFHGDKEKGVYIGNEQENIPWAELVESLREINIISRNNLGVVMAGCHSIYALMQVGPLEPTPFYFLLGCERAIGSGELEENIARFYKKLFDGDSLSEAMKVVVGKLPAFLAEKEFIAAMVEYFRNQSRGKGKDVRVERTVTKWVKLHPDHARQELTKFRTNVKTFFKPSIDEFYRNADIFLHGRYSVSADDVLSFLETLQGPSKSLQ